MVEQSGIVAVHGFCKRCQRLWRLARQPPPDTPPPPLRHSPIHKALQLTRRGIDLIVRLIEMHSYQPRITEDSTLQSSTKLSDDMRSGYSIIDLNTSQRNGSIIM